MAEEYSNGLATGMAIGQPYCGSHNGGMFGGNGWGDLLGLIVVAGMFGGFNGGFGGFGGGNNMLYDINANTNRGFDQAAIVGGLNGIQSALSDAQVARCNDTTTLLQALNGVQAAQAQCCCENRLAVAGINTGLQDLKYTIATENCADRAAISDGIRDVIESNTRNTQLVLDKLCAQEIEAKNDLIAQLRSQLNMADLRASQTAQNAFISQGFANEVDQLYNRLSSCPVPTTPVYGRTPIFTCNNNGGCGCASVQ